MIRLIMPMAGKGTRFNETLPKPLIDVNGLPMFVQSERCIGLDFEERIFITRKEHNMQPEIQKYYPGAKVIEIDVDTQGTACTLQIAEEYMHNGSLFVANCDQIVQWDKRFDWRSDGAIAVFHNPERNPKWSFAEVHEDRGVTRVAEKDPISEWATVGWYYYRRGSFLKQAIADMIKAKDTVNDEYYTCPTYNYMIKRGMRITSFEVQKMIGIGTAKDLNDFHSTQR